MDFYEQVMLMKEVSHNFPKFKQTDTNTWNCRCYICGDSEKNPNKMRGYFYKYEETLMYKCHNCGYSNNVCSMLNTFFPKVHKLSKIESLRQWQRRKREQFYLSLRERRLKELAAKEPKKAFAALSFFRGCPTVADCPTSSRAYRYLKDRGLEDKADMFYYIEDAREFVKRFPSPPKVFLPWEAIAIPHWNEDKSELLHLQLRVIDRRAQTKYLSVDTQKDTVEFKPYGLDRVDLSKPVYVTEGAFDSIFVDNCIAIGGLSKYKMLKPLIEKGVKLRFIVDNDWRYNEQVEKLMKEIAAAGMEVVTLPKEYTPAKDINEMVLRFPQLKGERLMEILEKQCKSEIRLRLEVAKEKKTGDANLELNHRGYMPAPTPKKKKTWVKRLTPQQRRLQSDINLSLTPIKDVQGILERKPWTRPLTAAQRKRQADINLMGWRMSYA